MAGEEFVPHVPRRLDLTPGERLVYDVRWWGLPAGQGVLEVKRKRDFEGREAYHVVCEARANSLVSSGVCYPVEDRTVSTIDVEGCFSRLFQMSKRENRVKQDEYIYFEYDKNRAVYEKRRPGPFQTRTKVFVRIYGKMQDPLSCLYYLRTLDAEDLAPGSTVRMPVHTVRRTWALVVEVQRCEELDIPGFGKMATLRIKPIVRFPGIFVRKGGMVVWIEKKTRIPVRMNVDIPIGSMKVTLASAENSPLTPVSKESPAPEGKGGDKAKGEGEGEKTKPGVESGKPPGAAAEDRKLP
ncbi:MAG: DUF3108 domain-containing protein [Planctomycetota bacterium]|jgi:hypothetical protein